MREREIELWTRSVWEDYLSVNVLAKFHGKASILRALLIHLKMRDSL